MQRYESHLALSANLAFEGLESGKESIVGLPSSEPRGPADGAVMEDV